MAFRLSQKAFGQLLKTQTRSLSTSSLTKPSAALQACSSRLSSIPSSALAKKAFSTSRVTLNEAVEAKTAPAEPRTYTPPEGTPSNGGRTVFFGNLPFFTEKDKFEELLKEFGAFENVRWANSKAGAPICLVTFHDAANASALVESSGQEPFYYGGRQLRVHLAMDRPGYQPRERRGGRGDGSPLEREPIKFPPSARVYFKDFVGDTVALRDWLGDHAQYVNSARFSTDKETGQKRNVGMIMFTSTERATECIRDKKNVPGPDGTPVYLRYANAQTLVKREEAMRRKAGEQQQASGQPAVQLD